MTFTHNEKKSELFSIDEEKVTLEKMRKQVLEQEEEIILETTQSMHQLTDSIEKWQEDPVLKNIFYDQQTLLADMQKKQVEFTEEFEEQLTSYRSQLAKREEDCHSELRKLDEQDKTQGGEA